MFYIPYFHFRDIGKGNLHKGLLLILAVFSMSCDLAYAQTIPLKKLYGSVVQSKSSSISTNYTQVGTTKLYYYQSSSSIDVQGYYEGYYYGSTFSNGGYNVAMQVNESSATSIDCLNGTTVDSVFCLPSIEQQGELARVCYTVTNTSHSNVTISLGTHADVMIGDNDRAPISRRIDTMGNTYGLTMKDGNRAQLCVLFGSGLAGVTAISDFWFGYYGLNNSASAMVGNYSSGSNYMEEDGSYDSGMGWCWKNRAIPAGSTVVFSYLIGVGEVNLEPNSSFEVTPDDPEGWNDLSRPHRLTLNGTYDSPAGLQGVIDYAVEDSEEWHALTDTLSSGDEFTASLVAMFDQTKSTHIIKFRTRDLVGNTTSLQPIQYVDVSYHALSGIEEKTFTGDSLFQTNVTCDLAEDYYCLAAYKNNICAGTAMFNIEGVFPNSIGRKTYTFTILPQTLTGSVTLNETNFVYNGSAFTPEWYFTNENYSTLKKDTDYVCVWTDNILPGTGSLTVTGRNNYTGSLSATITIDKAQLTDNLFTLTLPDEDITYDEQSHGATISKANGVGDALFTYLKQGETEQTSTQPVETGLYDIYLTFSEGTLYYGRESSKVASFSIYEFNADEWTELGTIQQQLTEMSWAQPWDMSQGMKSASSLQGLTIEKGHVTGLNFSNQNLNGAFPYSVLSLPQLKSLNLSGNKLSGTLSLAECPANLTTLDVSHNCLEDINPVIPSTVTSLNIGQQTIARVVALQLSNISTETIAEKVPSILLYDHANQTYTTDINLLCTTKDNSWGMIMAYQDGQLSIPYVSEQNTYYGASGDTLNVAVVYNDGTREGSTFRIALSFDDGDSNFDGKIDATDLQSTILDAFNEFPNNRPFNFTAADTYKDSYNRINVQDVICTVNMLLAEEGASNGAKGVFGLSQDSQATQLDSNEASVFVRNGKVILSTSTPVAALTVKTDGIVDWSIGGYGLTQNTTNSKLVGYSLAETTIPVGEIVIGTCRDAGTSVIKASLSDAAANAITVSVGSDSTTSINEVDGTSPCGNDFYDVTGRKHSVIQKGLNIIKHNSDYKKVVR